MVTHKRLLCLKWSETHLPPRSELYLVLNRKNIAACHVTMCTPYLGKMAACHVTMCTLYLGKVAACHVTMFTLYLGKVAAYHVTMCTLYLGKVAAHHMAGGIHTRLGVFLLLLRLWEWGRWSVDPPYYSNIDSSDPFCNQSFTSSSNVEGWGLYYYGLLRSI